MNVWGAPYKKVGQDGMNGSDANVPSYVDINGLDFTGITNSYIKSPRIFATWLTALPINFKGSLSNIVNYKGISYNEGFRLFGEFNGGSHEYLAIAPYNEGTNPALSFFSPHGCYAKWLFENSQFYGNLDFSRANSVTGLYLTFS